MTLLNSIKTVLDKQIADHKEILKTNPQAEGTTYSYSWRMFLVKPYFRVNDEHKRYLKAEKITKDLKKLGYNVENEYQRDALTLKV